MQTPKNILSHKRFRRLTQQMDHLARFNDALAPCLPNHLVGHVYAASAIPPTLVLHTAHSGFATELRFRASEILERIRFITEYTTFTQLKIKVMTDVIEPRQRIGKPNRIDRKSVV